jgi:hypothetical protein
MSPKALLSRLPVDPYIVAIVGMVCLASGLPAYGSGTIVARYATNAAIALLFFLHGARLSPQAALAGASHWRLHIVVLASTFVLFPALGLGAKALFPAGVVGWSPLRLRRGTFFGGAEQIVRERGRLRRQDLEGSPLTCRGRSSQATSYGDQGQEQGRGGHKVKKAVDAETSHHACANQRADDGAQPTN